MACVTLVCTDRGQHEDRPVRVGEVDHDGWIVTLALTTGRRTGSEVGMVNPERCPLCRRTPRRTREAWQKIAAGARAAGMGEFDVSYLDDTR